MCANGSKGLAIGKPFLGSAESNNGSVNGTSNGSAPSDRDKGCMCCEMDRAFEEVGYQLIDPKQTTETSLMMADTCFSSTTRIKLRLDQ